MATKRLNFSVAERDILLRLIEEHIEIVESKKNDGLTVRRKDDVWAEIVARFNAEPEVVRRTHRQLRKYWNNLKMRAKKSASSSAVAALGGGVRRRSGSGSYTVRLPTASNSGDQPQQHRASGPSATTTSTTIQQHHHNHQLSYRRSRVGPSAAGRQQESEGRSAVVGSRVTEVVDVGSGIKEEPGSSPPPPPLHLAERLDGDAGTAVAGLDVQNDHRQRLYRHHQQALQQQHHRTAVPVALTAPPLLVDHDRGGRGDDGPDSEADVGPYSDDDNRGEAMADGGGGGAMEAEDGGDDELGHAGEDGVLIDSDEDDIGDHFNGVDGKEFGHETAAGGLLGGPDGCCVGGQWTALDLARREHEAKMALLTVQMETAHEQRELAREVRQQTRQRHRLEMQVLEEKRRYRRRKLNSLGPHHGPS